MKMMNKKLLYAGIGLMAVATAYWAGTQNIPSAEQQPKLEQVGMETIPQQQTATTSDVEHAQPNTPAANVVSKQHLPTTPNQAQVIKDKGMRFAHFRVGNSNVKAMLDDGDILWVGTSGGVIRYDKAKDEHRLFDVRSGLLSNGIFHLSKYGRKLAVGTYGGGLSLLDPETEVWENYNIQHGLADAFIYDLLEMENGDVWIATWSGANRVIGGEFDNRSAWQTFTVENTKGGLPNDWVYAVAKGSDKEVWMATEGGLARYKDGNWKNWKHEDGLGAPYDLVKDQIEFDRDPAKESSHHARQKVEMGLQSIDVAYNPNYIVSLHVTPQGIVWCGTWGGGLARFDGEVWSYFTANDGLPANHIFMLEPAENGDLWIGTSNGLSRFNGKSFDTLTTHDGLFANNVFSLAMETNGTLWVGSFGGVSKLQNVKL
ncbi:MAG: two-component regulator propeller domain-containing protein [Candidatus Thiodiazotropha taylori]|nr:regulator [Candidatus Thiodiazotropha taylori]MCG8085552.1 regulator [Candidatus Thiodiazotropha taylori]MCG8095895.1 regulator [Candidatus Thiodiazotropha endolucinida]MCW4327443.1 regulator [Candidatus Thiodiazotropha taylori]